VVDLSPVAGQRMAIPHGNATLPGFFFRAPDARPGEPRPVLVINNGLASPTSHTWAHGGAAAAAHGYHWATLDGPGQQAALYELGLPCRFDWEAVLTPVLDTLVTRSDVDPNRIAAIGIGQGAYLLTRALCFEHRLAAAVADPGIIDLAVPWLDRLSPPLRRHLEAGDRAAFDRETTSPRCSRPPCRRRFSCTARRSVSIAARATTCSARSSPTDWVFDAAPSDPQREQVRLTA
jgi:hypothetical protein